MQDDSHTDFLPGFLLDRYRVEQIISEKGSRAVIRAFDTHTKRPVIVKVLKCDRLHGWPDQYRIHKDSLEREVGVAGCVGFHSHIVSLLDFVSGDDDALYLILECISGSDLKATLAQGPLIVDDALRIAADIADGLHTAHELGIVHCDVRPKNIFVTQNMRAKIGNFGRARIDGGSTFATTMSIYLGSSLYVSPEQEDFSLPTTDQYNLGLVVFEMLTGRIFKTISGEEAAVLIAQQPQPLRSIVQRMLARHPDDRYATLRDVRAELASLIVGTPDLGNAIINAACGDISAKEIAACESNSSQESAQATMQSPCLAMDIGRAWGAGAEPIRIEKGTLPVTEHVDMPIQSDRAAVDLPIEQLRSSTIIADDRAMERSDKRPDSKSRILGLLLLTVYIAVAAMCLIVYVLGQINDWSVLQR